MHTSKCFFSLVKWALVNYFRILGALKGTILLIYVPPCEECVCRLRKFCSKNCHRRMYSAVNADFSYYGNWTLFLCSCNIRHNIPSESPSSWERREIGTFGPPLHSLRVAIFDLERAKQWNRGLIISVTHSVYLNYFKTLPISWVVCTIITSQSTKRGHVRIIVFEGGIENFNASYGC